MDVNLGEILPGAENRPVNKISTDTRTIEPGDIFFALAGPHFDGHDFLVQAIEKGAHTLVVADHKKITPDLKKKAQFIAVPDTLQAYGDAAKRYRQKFRIPTIAITGSSGKTTVKELVAHVLSARFKVLKNRGTENNLVGVPKTLFQLEPQHEAMVLEIGTNQPGEIERLASIVRPQIGILTQIGCSHLEGLKTIEGVREEKLRLLHHIERGGKLILNGEDAMLTNVRSGVHQTVRVGFSKDTANFFSEQVWYHDQGTSFRVSGDLYETQLIGRHNVLNALLAIVAAQSMGMTTPEIQKAVASFKPVAGRLSLKNVDGIIFIDDSYNSNPGSFEAALKTLKNFKIRDKKIVVCGDMLEMGDKKEEVHRQAGALIAELLFDAVIAAGPLNKYLVDEAVKRGFDPTRIHSVKDSEEAGRLCRKLASSGDMVLVKGSRGMKMEKVFDCFITSSIR